MSHPNRNRYAPDSVTPPGFYIREKLEEIGMTESGLATAIGLPALGEIVDDSDEDRALVAFMGAREPTVAVNAATPGSYAEVDIPFE